MVYHNLSMSLNHHVPIFNCTVTRWGGLSLLFRHLTNCKLTVLSATPLAFLHHTHRHTQTDWWPRLVTFMSSLNPPPPCVTSPVLGHVTLLYIDCGHFGFELHIQCPFVHTTDALRKGVTQLGGKERWNNLFSVTIFRPFLTWKKHDLVFTRLFLFLFLFVFPLSLYMEDQTLLSQASRDLKINLLSITHECKDYSSCDLKERILYCSFH